MTLFTRKYIALQLGINESTLSHKLTTYNLGHLNAPIMADVVKRKGNIEVHFFKPESLARIKEAVESVSTRRRGRPAKVKEY